MSHIAADTLEQLKQKLLERREKLLAMQKEVEAESPKNTLDHDEMNASEDADAREDVEVLQTEAVESQLGDTLARVEAALDRIEKGTYGHTADGKEIPVERLLVDPTATTLVS
jgi:RNA polymerase-binding transcription factor DksA